MRAAVYHAYGPPSQLRIEDRPSPVPGAEQILVRVRACGVNPIDWKIFDGKYRFLMPARFPGIPGFDLAGEVAGLGRGVVGWSVGERVYARTDARLGNAVAELAVVSASVMDRVPAALSWEQAAALPLAAMTALQSFTEAAHVGASSRVLVTGASGGVGHLAIQVAKALGATVTAHVRPTNEDFVRELGAAEVVDHAVLPRASYDVVLETGTWLPYGHLERSLVRGGTLVSLAVTPRRIASRIYAPFLGRHARVLVSRADGALMRRVSALVEAGQLRPFVERTFRFEDIAHAYEHVRSGQARGKTVVLLGRPE